MTDDLTRTPPHLDYRAVTHSATPSRAEYLKLAEHDEMVDGRLSAHVESEGFTEIAEQIRMHVYAIQADRGPICAGRHGS